MKVLKSLHCAVSVLLGKHRFEHELEEELASHLRDRTEHLVRGGRTPAEAERQARLEFGAVERYKEECRENTGTYGLDAVAHDVRYAARLLRQSPGFTAVAVLTLALGIGATTSIFTLINGILLRPLSYVQPNQLVLVTEANVKHGIAVTGCSYPDLLALLASGTFSQVAGVNRHGLNLTGAGEPAQVDTVVVTPEIFPLLGSKPLLGRYLLPQDERDGAPATVVLSEHLWRSRFGSRPEVVGSSVILDDKPFTVAGIMPANFRVPVFGERQDVWIPVAQDPLFGSWKDRRGGHWLRVIGRMQPGLTVQSSQSRVNGVSADLARVFPADNREWSIEVSPLQKALVRDVQGPLLTLFSAVGLLLCLSCVNLANLLVARATARSREITIRRALGAGRRRIVQQMLTESSLVGLAGGTAGIALAWAVTHSVTSLLPMDLPAVREVHFDVHVLLFSLGLAISSTLLFGAFPAFFSSGMDLQSSLRDNDARSGVAPTRVRMRKMLAVIEIAFAGVLVIGAGLLMRSLEHMLDVNPGFRVRGIVKAEVDLPRYRYTKPQQWTLFSRRLLERVQATSGLADAALAVPLPLSDGFINLGFGIPHHAAPPPGMPSTANYVSVSPAYFRVMGISLLKGRFFSRMDGEHDPRVTIITEAFARTYFSGEDPVGKVLNFGFPPDGDVVRTIVGVAGDVHDVGLTRPPGPMMYVPFEQAPFWGGELIVNTTLPVPSVADSIRQVVHEVDPALPVTGVTSMREVVAGYVAQPKLRASLFAGFGVVALFLAALGVFGLLSYSVSMRTREFGVRSALGASRQSIARTVLQEGLILGLVGVFLGFAGAAASVQFLKAELYGMTAYDPIVFMGTGAVLLVVSLAACYWPAWRAMHVDPVVALRT